jgi:hypothetical protein
MSRRYKRQMIRALPVRNTVPDRGAARQVAADRFSTGRVRGEADRMERVMGIEPTLAAWEAAVLPLNYTRIGLRQATPATCADIN